MAVTYTAVEVAAGSTKLDAYASLATMMLHLVAFGVDIVSMSRNANGIVHVVLSGSIPSKQLAHVGLQ